MSIVAWMGSKGLTSQKVSNFLTIFIIGMTLVLLGMTLYKKGVFDNLNLEQYFDFGNKPKVEQVDSDDAWKKAVDENIAYLRKELTIWQNRTWLLAVANNQNANVSRQLACRLGISNAGFISFLEDWSLNQKPSTLKVDESQLPLKKAGN